MLALGDAVTTPKELVHSGLQLLAEDLRVASVSFFSNDAAYLSFPERNRPVGRPPEGHDAQSVSRRLRENGVRTLPVPILMAAGPAILLSSSALGAVGALSSGPERSFNAAMADFSARSRNRGFVHLLDDTNFVGRHRSPFTEPEHRWPIDDIPANDRHWFYLRHPADLAVLKSDAELGSSPISISHGLARAKVRGLRIAVDGYDVGPHEMGTQVAVLSAVEALIGVPSIREILVMMAGPVPPYARAILDDPKVQVAVAAPHRFPEFERCDVAHRMGNPNPGFDPNLWRCLADRVVVSVLDVIAYRIGAYHEDEKQWLEYREAIRRNVSGVDAVTVISEDVKRQVELERLPIDADRLETIRLGTEHLSGDEGVNIPVELVARGFVAEEFRALHRYRLLP